MLTNEIYIGNMVQGRSGSISYKTKQCKPKPKEQWIVVENTHEPIIDMELWNKAQALIKQKTKAFSTGEIGLFARKARCMYCGYTLRSNKHANGQYYLRCGTRYVSKQACEGCMISVKHLEKVVLQELHELNAKYLDEQLIEEKADFNGRTQEQIKKYEVQTADYQKKIDDCSEQVKALYRDKLKGIITEDEFIDLSHELHKDKERFNKLIEEANSQIEEIKNKLLGADNCRELVKNYTNTDHLTREMVDILIDRIEIGKRIPKTKERPIKIYWNF